MLIRVLAPVTFVGAAEKSAAQVQVWRNGTLPIVFMKIENADTEHAEASVGGKVVKWRAKKSKREWTIVQGK